MDYDVEPLTSDTFDELGPLMKDAFGQDADRRYFDWKYLGNPAGPAIGHIARDRGSGEIAAFYGMIPEVYRWGAERRRIFQSCDTMTHSGHRRKGLFKLLALETYGSAKAADPTFFAYGFGGPTSTPGFLKMGWRIEIELPYLFRPYPLTLLRTSGTDVSLVEKLDDLDERLIALVQKSAEKRKATIDKSAEFVRWRLSNPLVSYAYLAEGNRAYAIYTRSSSILFLFDFWESSAGEGRNVWEALRRASLEPGCKGILTFCQKDTADWRRLRSWGLLHNPFGRGPASGSFPFITYGESPGEWAITPFDHDSY